MTPTAFALIVLAGLIHAGWNIVAKKAAGDARFAFFTAFIMMLLWAPLGWWLGRDVVPTWGRTEWVLVVARTAAETNASRDFIGVILRGL